MIVMYASKEFAFALLHDDSKDAFINIDAGRSPVVDGLLLRSDSRRATAQAPPSPL